MRTGKFSFFTLSILSALSVSQTAMADILSGDINNNTLKLQYIGTNTGSNLDFEGALLYNRKDGRLFNIGARVAGDSLVGSELKGALGGRLYYVSPKGPVDGTAFAIGGEIDYTPPQVSGLGISAELYYAPSVLTVDKLDNLFDVSLKVKYRVIENGSVYIGARQITADTSKYGEADIDKSLHVGMQLDL